MTTWSWRILHRDEVSGRHCFSKGTFVSDATSDELVRQVIEALAIRREDIYRVDVYGEHESYRWP